MAKKRRHPQQSLPPRGPRVEEIINRAQHLQSEGRLEEALDILEEAPPHLQRRPEVRVGRGVLNILLGDITTGIEILEEAAVQHPDIPSIHFFLAGAYYQFGWLAHTLRALRRVVLDDDVLDRKSAEAMQADMVADAITFINENAAQLNVSPSIMEEALFQSEWGERLVEQERFEEAARTYRKAHSLVPAWLEPRNDEAMAHFDSGNVDLAYRIAQEVLAAQPDNVFALNTLVHIHIARGELAQAQECGQQIVRTPLRSTLDVSKAIEALGLVNEDAAILNIYKRYKKESDELSPLTMLIVGSAAANLGKTKMARRLWRTAEQEGAPETAIEQLTTSLQDGAPGPGMAQRYPTAPLPVLIPVGRLNALSQLLIAAAGDDFNEREIGQEIERLAARTPHFVQAVVQLMWEENVQTGLQLLDFLHTPPAIAEIRRFALSQAGSLALRIDALRILFDRGELDPNVPVRLWDETRGRWRSMHLIHPDAPSYSPEVWAHIDAGTAALAEGDLAKARQQLQAAIELDPQATIAYHNLAVSYLRADDHDAARRHLLTAMQVNPNYVYARCTLAQIEITKDNLDDAEAALQPLDGQPILNLDDQKYYLRALAELAIARQDYDAAETHLKSILEIDPSDEALLKRLQEVGFLRVVKAPLWLEWKEQARRRKETKRRRPIRPDATLSECLQRLSKNELIVTARTMPFRCPYNVRKDLLVQTLVDHLTDPSWLVEILIDATSEDLKALSDVLAADGVMDWDEFTTRYGDDLDENHDLRYAEPESAMGYLRMIGLLSTGTIDDRFVVLIPADLRPLLPAVVEEVAPLVEELEAQESEILEGDKLE